LYTKLILSHFNDYSIISFEHVPDTFKVNVFILIY